MFFSVVNPRQSYIFSSRFALVEDVLINGEWLSRVFVAYFLLLGLKVEAY